MLYGNYAFRCRFKTEARLPEYKGSTFRGIFGRALKEVVCALKRRTCPDCLLKASCLYPRVFEPHLTAGRTEIIRGSAPPHPYVIRPPAEAQIHYPPGAFFSFNLLLFGPVNSQLAYFVYALDRMGGMGVGKAINGHKTRFVLEEVLSQGRGIYSRTCPKIDLADCTDDLRIDDPPSVGRVADCLTFFFETPLRLKHHNRLTPELPFHVLTRAMLRRVSGLMAAFGGGEPALDYAGLVQRAQQVRTSGTTLAWEDWRRYSQRQDQAMQMGDLKSAVTYEGRLTEFLPLIDFCQKVHLGKQTTFGLGRFRVEAAP
jgi:hypothetical protein